MEQSWYKLPVLNWLIKNNDIQPGYIIKYEEDSSANIVYTIKDSCIEDGVIDWHKRWMYVINYNKRRQSLIVRKSYLDECTAFGWKCYWKLNK